jgi:hypothetical protein
MKRPLYLHRTITRHGKIAWYFWRGRGYKKIRITGEYGSAEFNDQYAAILAGEQIVATITPTETPETLSWLISRYRETSAWSELSYATKRQRENIFKNVLAVSGQLPYKAIKRSHILATEG